jgi:hypothetical protein
VNEANQAVTKKSPSHSWTEEKLAREDKKTVQLLKERALKHGASDLADMCDRDLARRLPSKSSSARSSSVRSKSDVVIGYHFVCGRGRGVTESDAGRFWSGSWVVAELNAQKSLARGAYLALHEVKTEKSYRQGKIVDFRRSPRDMLADVGNGLPQTDEGIEFLVQDTSSSYAWVGDGSGEKGYLWASDGGTQ